MGRGGSGKVWTKSKLLLFFIISSLTDNDEEIELVLMIQDKIVLIKRTLICITTCNAKVKIDVYYVRNI